MIFDDIRKNLMAASELLASKPEKRTRARNRSPRWLWMLKLNLSHNRNSYVLFTLLTILNKHQTRKTRHNQLKTRQGKVSGRCPSKQRKSKSGRTKKQL
ncbi:MAG: hypothetical protein EZS28_035010 [Streblomastix strix]|uniref:Uncharacterized protein n=1 Tax=Streblomastix strix TaxID=222440 RepID=A0A5J4UHQ2_9EUKA|nr:MAG: hypothetical protein EZS28_035010 [Streblomastix strix]